MGPYRTPYEPAASGPEPEPRDHEDLVVHAVVGVVGVIGLAMALVERDSPASATLAAILVVVGVAGVLRR